MAKLSEEPKLSALSVITTVDPKSKESPLQIAERLGHDKVAKLLRTFIEMQKTELENQQK